MSDALDKHSVSRTTLETRLVTYVDGNVTFTGYLAYEKASSTKRPLVLIVHNRDGRDEFEDGKAEALARLGYVGFAVDVFGNGTSGQSATKVIRENRPLLLERLQLAMNEMKKIDVVDQSKICAIGFCFGGMAVLDMARAGWDLKGVVSFHGSLSSPPQAQDDIPIKAKILVLHGHDDHAITPESVLTFEQEMTKRKADWQVHVYSNTVHGFTEPKAGEKYNPSSDKRSWLSMKNYFDEVLV